MLNARYHDNRRYFLLKGKSLLVFIHRLFSLFFLGNLRFKLLPDATNKWYLWLIKSKLLPRTLDRGSRKMRQ